MGWCACVCEASSMGFFEDQGWGIGSGQWARSIPPPLWTKFDGWPHCQLLDITITSADPFSFARTVWSQTVWIKVQCFASADNQLIISTWQAFSFASVGLCRPHWSAAYVSPAVFTKLSLYLSHTHMMSGIEQVACSIQPCEPNGKAWGASLGLSAGGSSWLLKAKLVILTLLP